MSARGRRVPTVGIVLLAVLATAITACDSDTDGGTAPSSTSTPRSPVTDVYEVPDQLRDATMVWSADPEVDLFSTEGTLTRATQESIVIGMTTGLDYTYIGFAGSGNYKGGDSMYSIFQSETGEGPFAGTVRGHIQQIVPNDVGFDAVTCVLSVGLDVLENDKYSPSLVTDVEGGELRIRFIRTGDQATTPTSPAPSSGPGPENLHWQAPAGNEFIGWEIDGFADTDPVTAGNGRCLSWARSLYPDASPIVSREAYANDNPPPVQPAYPGWPDNRY